MLRLDPGEGRIRNARNFQVWEGGGEYNVARGLTRCFGLKTAIVTALVENDVGYLVEDLIRQGGVDTKFIHWLPFDGIGEKSRNGLNFTERGFGLRAALGVSDRGHTAISQIQEKEIEWEAIFGSEGCKWFHTGGIFASLSAQSAMVAREAMEAAKQFDVTISYDLNYRPSLWKRRGGMEAAQKLNRDLLENVDVLFGNEEDFIIALGMPGESPDQNYLELDEEAYVKLISKTIEAFPNLSKVAITMRKATTASLNDWTAVGWSLEEGFVRGRQFNGLWILDRVGGGDSFASGFIFAALESKSLSQSLDYGLAHGALAMTTPGDTSMVSKVEVERLIQGKSARVQR
jgi:2-dehydro-3-deoxygluconokinase